MVCLNVGVRHAGQATTNKILRVLPKLYDLPSTHQAERAIVRLLLGLFAAVATLSLAGFPARSADGPLVPMPENAYRTKSSIAPGWECSWGFQPKGGACETIDVPDNGYLVDGGTLWNCTRGFKKVREKCVQIVVPEHGYFAGTGSYDGWECEYGYRKAGQSCA